MKFKIASITALLLIQGLLCSQIQLFDILYRGDLETFLAHKNEISDYNAKTEHGDSLVIVLLKGMHHTMIAQGGTTPLHIAAALNDVDTVALLLANGASPAIRDKSGRTAYQLAIYKGAIHAARQIKKHPAEASEEEKRYTTLLNHLLAQGSEVNTYDAYGKSALHYAVETGSLALVRALVDAGADIQYQSLTGPTALHISVSQGYYDISAYLLEKGANASATKKVSIRWANMQESKGQKQKSRYKQPGKYNLKIVIYEDKNINDEDRRCYYKIYLNDEEFGRTTTGLESQKKEFTALVEENRHLVKVVKYVLDKKREKYIKLNNIYQPHPDSGYVEVVKDRITNIWVEHVSEGDSHFVSQYELED